MFFLAPDPKLKINAIIRVYSKKKFDFEGAVKNIEAKFQKSVPNFYRQFSCEYNGKNRIPKS